MRLRHIAAVAMIVTLSACSGGGGGSAPQVGGGSTTPTTPTTPQSSYVTPTFVLTIPPRGTSSGVRNPKYIASTTASVTISVTADSAGVAIAGLTATTAISAAACTPSCSVKGPPSPPGTDSFLVVTYDGNAKPNALNAGTILNATITAGQANSQSVTLGGIPVTATIAGIPAAFAAGTQTQSSTVTVTALDADSNSIASGATPYVDASGNPVTLTLTDPDTASHGSCLVPSGTSTCLTNAGSTASFTKATDSASFAYDGLAENPITVTVSSPAISSATATFSPVLNKPVFVSSQASPNGVAETVQPEIDLFNTAAIGSTGSESFTESGWTNAPYGNALAVTTPSPSGCSTAAGSVATLLSQFATVSAGANSTTNGTPFTATATGTPVAGSCPATVSDGLTLNTTDSPATLTVTYTTFSVTGNAKRRAH